MANRKKRDADIDIAPLIDVIFMLIIFFVLTATFLPGRVVVDLPRGEGADGKTENLLMINLSRDGSVLWGDVSLPAPVNSGNLFRLARESIENNQEILIAGDEQVPYGEVAGLLDALRSAGVERLGLALRGK
ncbi:biopolymer transporter ExbD/TolR [Synergistales bacterium]|nr:biopolymer transporter ExbD/TolR [Synergistales bacterium]